MDTYVFQLILIMITGGLAGGFVNYFINRDSGRGEVHGLMGHLFLGVFGSFFVPLFLNMVSSRLLPEGKSDPLLLLSFLGVCLLFSMIPRWVLLWGKRWSTPSSPPQEGKREERTGPGGESPPEKPDGAAAVPETEPWPQDGMISENEYRIIKAVAEKKNGGASFSSILRESGMGESEFNETLSLMMAKGYIGQELGDSDRPNFSLTRKGLRLLGRRGRN